MNDFRNVPRPGDGEPSPLPDGAWPTLAARLNMTEREAAIVRALFQRMKEEAIAERLGISHHTVHTHLNRVYRKLEVQNRGDLFLRVLREYMADELTVSNAAEPRPWGSRSPFRSSRDS